MYRISITFSIRKAQIRTESKDIEIKISRMPMNSSYIVFHDRAKYYLIKYRYDVFVQVVEELAA